MEKTSQELIETRLREDKRTYAVNKWATWAGRIGGLVMVVGGSIAESKGYDGKMWMIGGAAVSLLAYVIHPYRQIQNRLEEEINSLQIQINLSAEDL